VSPQRLTIGESYRTHGFLTHSYSTGKSVVPLSALCSYASLRCGFLGPVVIGAGKAIFRGTHDAF
jgi:hypothetical protein